jgi:hypothetical protein
VASAAAAVDPVLVFDGVFEAGLAEALGSYGPGIYVRQKKNREEENGVLPPDALLQQPVEEFIESLLVALGDDAKEVEYWGREEWLAVESHRDCDEGAAAQGARRFPTRVYIAYLGERDFSYSC